MAPLKAFQAFACIS